jgi:hypothetical protein
MHRHPPYDEAYKAAIVARYLAGESAYNIEKDPDAPQGATIRRWANEAKRTNDLKDVIRAHIPSTTVKAPQITPHKPKRVLVIPDLHCPWEHPDSLEFLKAVRDKYQTTLTVCLGDEIDAMAYSTYPKNPDAPSAWKELEEAIEHLVPIYREFPSMMVCESNHTIRPWKRAFDSGLPAAFLPTVARVLRAPDGWEWRNHWLVDGVRYIHGDAGSSGFTAHIQYMRKFKQSVVIGHIHSFAGVNMEGGHFGMNAGCLIDPVAICFHYAKNMPIPVSIGCGVVIDGVEAHFIPMRCDDHGRWNGIV